MLARAFAVRESEDDKQARMGKPIDDVDAPDLATPINRPQQRRRCSHPRVPDPYWRSKSGAISFDLLAADASRFQLASIIKSRFMVVDVGIAS